MQLIELEQHRNGDFAVDARHDGLNDPARGKLQIGAWRGKAHSAMGWVTGGLRNGAVDQANWIEMAPTGRIERRESGNHSDRGTGGTQACLGSMLPW